MSATVEQELAILERLRDQRCPSHAQPHAKCDLCNALVLVEIVRQAGGWWGRAAARLSIKKKIIEAEASAAREAVDRLGDFLGLASHDLETAYSSMRSDLIHYFVKAKAARTPP